MGEICIIPILPAIMSCALETNENVRIATGTHVMLSKGKIIMAKTTTDFFFLTAMLLNQGERNGFIENTSKYWLLHYRNNLSFPVFSTWLTGKTKQNIQLLRVCRRIHLC